MRNALIVTAAVIILGLSYFAWRQYGDDILASMRPAAQPQAEEIAMSTYATSTFTLLYPGNFKVDEMYAYTQFEGKPIAGVKFTIPSSLTEGTNLSADSGISVEWLPRAKNCTGDIYIPANVKVVDLLVGSTTYSVATTTGAAAGNLYEEQVFAIRGSKPCTAVRYLIHSTNIGNYDPETVAEFDRDALIDEFDAIRDSLMLQSLL